MTKILVKCVEEVVHGPYTLAVGQKAMMDKHLAENDLKRFVEPAEDDDETKLQENLQLNKMMPESENGLGNVHMSPVESPPSEQPALSASPAAPASPPPTAKQPKAGATKNKGGR